MFLGLATTDRETPGYVKFVDSIEKLIDFHKTQGHTFQNNFKFRVLEYVVFLVSFRAAFLTFLGSFRGSFWVKKCQKTCLKMEQKRDPGRRGPRLREYGHLVVNPFVRDATNHPRLTGFLIPGPWTTGP